MQRYKVISSNSGFYIVEEDFPDPNDLPFLFLSPIEALNYLAKSCYS